MWEGAAFQVTFNAEEQYSIWPSDQKLPAGWFPTGSSGTKAECLAFIETQWTDMRPLSLRKAMGN
jgi:MbtH protein